MRNSVACVVIVLIGLWGAGCQSPRAPVTHVVVCWLKSPGDEAARQQVIDASQELRAIPGMISLRAGTVVPSPRPVVDSSFDVALVMVFRDVQALRDYDTHPIHQKVVAQTIKPLVERFIVYDFQE